MEVVVGSAAELANLVGTDLVSPTWIEITQQRIDAFAEATGDRQWIHVDPERAVTGPYGTTIAHGYLTLSLLPALTADLLRVRDLEVNVNYGLDRVRFVQPVPVGSRLRATGMIANVEGLESGVRVDLHVSVEIEGNPKPALVAETISLYVETAQTAAV